MYLFHGSRRSILLPLDNLTTNEQARFHLSLTYWEIINWVQLKHLAPKPGNHKS